MSQMAYMIANVMIFFGILMTVLGAAHALGVTGSTIEQSIKRRLQALTSGADPEAVIRLLRRKRESDGFGNLPGLRYWPALVRQAGIDWRPESLLAVLGITTVVLAISFSAILSWPLALVFALGLGSLLPVMLLNLRRARRRAELSKQLPDAIDLMVQSLRAGHPINPAFNIIAREMPDPIASELGLVADAISYGDDLATAIEEMAGRLALEDFNYLAVAITIQHSTGGNLATVLESLGTVIRDRFAMERKIKALSAEGRITAIVVSIVPIALAVFLHLSTPSYYADVAEDPLFAPLLALGVLLTLANAIALRRQVKFDF
ncbi:MAG: type II secretion system F family protein [Pseudomonadota bacterium]